MNYAHILIGSIKNDIEEVFPFVTIDRWYRDEITRKYHFIGDINLIEGEFKAVVDEMDINTFNAVQEFSKNKDDIHKLYDVISERCLDYTIELIGPDYMLVRDDKFKYEIFIKSPKCKYVMIQKEFKNVIVASDRGNITRGNVMMMTLDTDLCKINLPKDINNIFNVFEELRSSITKELNL